MSVYLPRVSPLVAARIYLLEELGARGVDLPVGVIPPQGDPTPYALLSRPGGMTRVYLSDYMIRVRVFDHDAVRLEDNAELMFRLLLGANHRKIVTPTGKRSVDILGEGFRGAGSVWVTGTKPQMSPTDFDDPTVPMFGYQMAVFWTISLHPETTR
jgi:hypothetical protein